MKTGIRLHLFAFLSPAASGQNRHSDLRLCGGVFLALAVALFGARPAHANQTISLPTAGLYYEVGCQVSGPGGNSITNKLFLNAAQLPDGSQLMLFQCGGSPTGSNSFQTYIADSSSPSGWVDLNFNVLTSNVVWNPGEGVVINPAAPATLTLNGTNATPVLPPLNYCGCGFWALLCAQTTNAISSFQDVTGFLPSPGAQVAIYNSATSAYVTYSYTPGGWTPSTPVLTNDSAAFFYVPCAGNCPPITLSPGSLPGGAAGVSYSQTITASGGVPPYTFAVTSGALPVGLTLGNNGVLSGTPTVPAVAAFTVTVTDTNGCTGSVNYELTISNSSSFFLLSTYGRCSDTNVILAFSNPLLASSATNLANFHIVCGGQSFDLVASALLGDDPRLLKLTLPMSLGNLGGSCGLSIIGLMDVYSNTITLTNLLPSCTTNTCASSSSGTEFWLTFPGNYAPDPTNPPQVKLYISGAPGTVGTASIPGFDPPFISSFTIPGAGMVSLNLPSAADLGDANDVVGTNGIHVVASEPVAIDAFDHVPYTTDAYLGLPAHDLGYAYIVMTYSNVYTNIPDLNGSQFAIVAPADNTTVTIVPSVPVGGHPANTPFNVSLMQGQTYQLRDTNDAPADLTGTTIVGDEPIAVFGSHRCTSVPAADDFFCDYLVQQLFPVNLWGTNFLTVPFATRLDGDTFRCLAWQSGTSVFTNGVSAGTINEGQFLQFQLLEASQITSSAPILVAQFADSSDFDGVENADPLMLLVPPTTLYGTRYHLVSPSPSDFLGAGGFPSANYVNIVALKGSSVLLDGSLLSMSDFTDLGISAYSYAQESVNPGPHTITSLSGGVIGVTAYGWSQYDAYGYPAGICGQTNEGVAPQFTCPSNVVQVTASPSNNMASVPDLTSQVGNAGAAVSITQTPQPGTLVGPGSYTITVTIVDQFGDRQQCVSTLIVTANVPGTIGVTTLQGGELNLTWGNGAVLQGSFSPRGPWTNITTVSPYSVAPSNTQYFFRTMTQ